MPDPIEYQVVRNLQAALKAIEVASGYHTNIPGFAIKLDPNSSIEDLVGTLKQRPFIILEVSPDAFAYEPAKLARLTLPATVHAIADVDLTIDESWTRVFYQLCADIEQAVAVDITRGGLAVDTRILSRRFQTFNGQQVWAMVDLQITVRRTYGLPNG